MAVTHIIEGRKKKSIITLRPSPLCRGHGRKKILLATLTLQRGGAGEESLYDSRRVKEENGSSALRTQAIWKGPYREPRLKKRERTGQGTGDRRKGKRSSFFLLS